MTSEKTDHDLVVKEVFPLRKIEASLSRCHLYEFFHLGLDYFHSRENVRSGIWAGEHKPRHKEELSLTIRQRK